MEIDTTEEEESASLGICSRDGPSAIYVICVFAILLVLHAAPSPAQPSLPYDPLAISGRVSLTHTVSFNFKQHSNVTTRVASPEADGSKEKDVSKPSTGSQENAVSKSKGDFGGMTGARVIIGVSNGHQGTSFLGARARYVSGELSRRKVRFFFERNSDCVAHPCREDLFEFCPIDIHPKLKLRSWYTAIKGDFKVSQSEQEKLVSNVCMPSWLRKNSSKVVIMGHDTLFYLQGLLKYKNETHFIRLRRSRVETARSFTLSGLHVSPMLQFAPVNKTDCILQVLKPGKKHGHLNFYSLCPLERPEDVVLRPPSVDVWKNFSFYQRALWYIDEVEARWILFLEKNKGIRYSEFAWSSAHPDKYGSMAHAHKSIATLLGLLPAEDGHRVKPHVKTNTSAFNLAALYHDQDKEYQRKMRYSTETLRLISKVQF